MKRVIGLIRLSTAEQAALGKAGLDRQKADIAVAAKTHGLDVVSIVEVIESGAKVRGQADFERMYRDLRSGGFAGIVCSNLDRLVRPDCFADFGIYDVFRETKTVIYTPGGIVDPSSQTGFLETAMRSTFSGLERKLIAQRTLGGKEALRVRGEHPLGGNVLPTGVLYDPKTKAWSYDPVHAEKIKAAYKLLLSGVSYRAIGQRTGIGSAPISVRRVLQNPIWVGIRRYEPNSNRAEPLEIKVLPALLDEATFERAQELLRKRHKEWGSRLRPPRFLLTGVLMCSCGKRFYQSGAGKAGTTRVRDYYYCCSNFPRFRPSCGAPSVRRVETDKTITRELAARLSDPKFLLAAVTAAHSAATVPDTGASRRIEAIAKLEAKRKRIGDAHFEGHIPKAEYQERLRVVDSELYPLRSVSPAQPSDFDSREFVRRLARSFARFDALPFAKQQAILRRFVRAVVVKDRAITGFTLTDRPDDDSSKLLQRSTARYRLRCLSRE